MVDAPTGKDRVSYGAVSSDHALSSGSDECVHTAHVDVRSGHDFPVPQVDVAPPYDIVYSSYRRLLVSGRHVRAFSSGGERFPDTEEVRSSNLLTPTISF